MQTFLPDKNFATSASRLDSKRLGKQRVEALQIYNIVSTNRTTGGWVNHPAVRLWREFPTALAVYHDVMIREWIFRGFKNNMPFLSDGSYDEPVWLGVSALHDSHRSNLLRKNYDFYSQYRWDVPNDLPYFWFYE
jgi:hypothetical protein